MAGHYMRPDVVRLMLNRSPQPRVERLEPGLKPLTVVGK
jgi:hypothetical protein